MPRHGPHTSDHPLPPPHIFSRQRNPWAAQGQWSRAPPGCADSSGNNSSSSASSRTYYQAVESSVYQEPLNCAAPPSEPGGYALPRDALLRQYASAPPPPPPPPQPTTFVTHQQLHYPLAQPPPQQQRPVTPASCATSTDGGVNACGGHCVPLENFCHYCLQVLFIAGILTGVSLVIAGSVLRGQKRGGDLMVLVYIGVLIALVCTLLLSVQCCVRRNVKRRRRLRRGRRGTAGAGLRQGGEAIQLQALGQPPLPGQMHTDPMLRSLVPQRPVELHPTRSAGWFQPTASNECSDCYNEQSSVCSYCLASSGY